MDDKWHNYAGCVAAYSALAEASDRVTAQLKQTLDAQFALGIGEFDTLLFVNEQRDKNPCLSDLLTRLRLSQPAVSRLVDRLAKRGLVQRENAKDDGRSVIIHLTPDGKQLLERAIPVHAQCIHESLLDRLTDEERAALKVILLKISGPATRP